MLASGGLAAWIKLLVFGGIFYHLYNQVGFNSWQTAKLKLCRSSAVLAGCEANMAGQIAAV